MSHPDPERRVRATDRAPRPDPGDAATIDSRCPVCGEPLVQEKCKVVCRSATCVYRIVFNCSEF